MGLLHIQHSLVNMFHVKHTLHCQGHMMGHKMLYQLVGILYIAILSDSLLMHKLLQHCSAHYYDSYSVKLTTLVSTWFNVTKPIEISTTATIDKLFTFSSYNIPVVTRNKCPAKASNRLQRANICTKVHIKRPYISITTNLPQVCSGRGQNWGLTHLMLSSSNTVPLGHWHPATHWRVQGTGSGFAHVSGQAVPHDVNTWPSIEQLCATWLNYIYNCLCNGRHNLTW